MVGSLVQLTGGFAAGLGALALIAAAGAALSIRLKVPAPVPLGGSSSGLPITT